MRDLLNLLDNLAESRGLSARNPGEIYSRGANAEIIAYSNESYFHLNMYDVNISITLFMEKNNA